MDEAFIRKTCDEIIAHKPDLVITEKGVSDLAQHFLVKAGITAVRRLRKTDNLRVARCAMIFLRFSIFHVLFLLFPGPAAPRS